MRWSWRVMWPSIGDDMGHHWWGETLQIVDDVMVEMWGVRWVVCHGRGLSSGLDPVVAYIFYKRIIAFCSTITMVLDLLQLDHCMDEDKTQEHTNLCDSCQQSSCSRKNNPPFPNIKVKLFMVWNDTSHLCTVHCALTVAGPLFMEGKNLDKEESMMQTWYNSLTKHQAPLK